MLAMHQWVQSCSVRSSARNPPRAYRLVLLGVTPPRVDFQMVLFELGPTLEKPSGQQSPSERIAGRYPVGPPASRRRRVLGVELW